MDSLPNHLLIQCLGRLPRPDQALGRCVCRRFNYLLSLQSVMDHRIREGMLEPWLCVLGGIQEGHGERFAEMFDFKDQKWRPMLGSPPKSLLKFCCAVVDCNLYVLGGYPTMFVYNTRTSTWKGVTRMTKLREACSCGVIAGNIYVSGGRTAEEGAESSAEVYIPHANRWFSIASMQEARKKSVSAIVDGKLYVIGGYGPLNNPLRTVEMYDPLQNAWTNKSSMPTLWTLAGCAAIGSKIYVIGTSLVTVEGQQVAVYDTESDEWEFAGTIPLSWLVTVAGYSLWGCAVAAAQGKLYILGGASLGDGGGINTVLVYDPLKHLWTSTREMKSRRHRCVAIVMNL